MFSGGIFVMIAAILRCVLILTVSISLVLPVNLYLSLPADFYLVQAGANGAQQAGSWAVRETFVAVVIGNIPMIQPLFTSAARKIGSYRTNSSYHRSGERSDGNSTVLSIKNWVKSPRKQPRTANPLSVSSSAENIIGARYQKNQNKNRSSARVSETDNGIYVMNQLTVKSESLKEPNDQLGTVGSSHCNVSA